MAKKRIIFMGTPAYATTILKHLLESQKYEIVALFTQPDKPVGRKKIITPPHIKEYIQLNKLDIEILQPERFSGSDESKHIANLNPDFIVVAAYGQILPKDIVEGYECINLHASLLPKYRGASPIQEMVRNLDKYIGVTCMRMAEGLDDGDILGYRLYKSNEESAEELFEDLAEHAGSLLLKILNSYTKLQNLEQIGCNANYCKKIKKSDGELSLQNAQKAYAKYRAYKSWPSVFLKSGLKIKEMSLQDCHTEGEEGKIHSIEDDHIVVECKKGLVRVDSVQPPSKPTMDIISYLRGKRIGVGDYLS